MYFRVLILMCLMSLVACSSQPKMVESWPTELPQVEIFVAEYERDSENQDDQSLRNYLTWVKRFYQGWIVYERGWLKMSSELSDNIKDNENKDLAMEKIHQVGLMIAPEWAKEKDSRYIKTSHVSVWGESLLEALSRGSSIEFMDRVMGDIDLLKQGQLMSTDIQITRYFPDLAEEDDSFFGF